jgi:hypothetical protein
MAAAARVDDEAPRRALFASISAQIAAWSEWRDEDIRIDAETCSTFARRPDAW